MMVVQLSFHNIGEYCAFGLMVWCFMGGCIAKIV